MCISAYTYIYMYMYTNTPINMYLPIIYRDIYTVVGRDVYIHIDLYIYPYIHPICISPYIYIHTPVYIHASLVCSLVQQLYFA